VTVVTCPRDEVGTVISTRGVADRINRTPIDKHTAIARTTTMALLTTHCNFRTEVTAYLCLSREERLVLILEQNQSPCVLLSEYEVAAS
jgi:hypothetical protein